MCENSFKGCVIKKLPKDEWESAARKAIDINPVNAPALHNFGVLGKPPVAFISAITTKYWQSGQVSLTVGFLETTPNDLQDKIISYMNHWGNYGNVKFSKTSDDADVRITRTSGGGHWSYHGTDICSPYLNKKPTMNLDSFTMNTPDSEFYRVVEHETGHTLGFPHEHMREEIIKKLDVEKTIKFYMDWQGWSREQVVDQILTPIPENVLLAMNKPDPTSIMCYWFPGKVTVDGKDILGGMKINANDGAFVGKIYPKTV